jgi:hypothetical protein
MKKILVMFAILAVCTFGCAIDGPSVCDDIEQGESVLCDAMKDSKYRIEDVGNALIVANIIAIGEGVYTREDAVELCEDVITLLENPLEFVSIRKLNEKYPGLLDIVQIYVGSSFDIDMGLYPTDRKILIKWFKARIDSMSVPT